MRKFTRFLLIALALLMALSTVACSSGTPASSPSADPTPIPEISVPVQDIADELMALPDQFGALGFMGEDVLTDLIGLDFSMLEEYSLNDAMMNVHAHILYVAKVKDETNMESVKAAFQTRLELMQASFERYLPEQYDLAMDGKIEVNGKYILLVISADSQTVVDKFNELLTAA